MWRPEITRIRAATPDDFYIFFGTQTQKPVIGLVAEDDRMILGIGGLVREGDRYFATFKRAPGVRHNLTAHKAAKEILAFARELKVDIYATQDSRIEKSAFWLKRLGFKKTAEKHNEMAVWRWVQN
jgi:hypothetical protein